MEKTTSESDPRTLYIDTNLDTHFVTIISDSDSVSDLKKKIVLEHPQCFPRIGQINVHGLKVKRKGHFYHLSDSLLVKNAFDEVKRHWFLSVDASRCMEHSELEFHTDPSAYRNNLLLSLPQFGSDQHVNQKVLDGDLFSLEDSDKNIVKDSEMANEIPRKHVESERIGSEDKIGDEKCDNLQRNASQSTSKAKKRKIGQENGALPKNTLKDVDSGKRKREKKSVSHDQLDGEVYPVANIRRVENLKKIEVVTDKSSVREHDAPGVLSQLVEGPPSEPRAAFSEKRRDSLQKVGKGDIIQHTKVGIDTGDPCDSKVNEDGTSGVKAAVKVKKRKGSEKHRASTVEGLPLVVPGDPDTPKEDPTVSRHKNIAPDDDMFEVDQTNEDEESLMKTQEATDTSSVREPDAAGILGQWVEGATPDESRAICFEEKLCDSVQELGKGDLVHHTNLGIDRSEADNNKVNEGGSSGVEAAVTTKRRKGSKKHRASTVEGLPSVVPGDLDTSKDDPAVSRHKNIDPDDHMFEVDQTNEDDASLKKTQKVTDVSSVKEPDAASVLDQQVEGAPPSESPAVHFEEKLCDSVQELGKGDMGHTKLGIDIVEPNDDKVNESGTSKLEDTVNVKRRKSSGKRRDHKSQIDESDKNDESLKKTRKESYWISVRVPGAADVLGLCVEGATPSESYAVPERGEGETVQHTKLGIDTSEAVDSKLIKGGSSGVEAAVKTKRRKGSKKHHSTVEGLPSVVPSDPDTPKKYDHDDHRFEIGQTVKNEESLKKTQKVTDTNAVREPDAIVSLGQPVEGSTPSASCAVEDLGKGDMVQHTKLGTDTNEADDSKVNEGGSSGVEAAGKTKKRKGSKKHLSFTAEVLPSVVSGDPGTPKKHVHDDHMFEIDQTNQSEERALSHIAEHKAVTTEMSKPLVRDETEMTITEPTHLSNGDVHDVVEPLTPSGKRKKSKKTKVKKDENIESEAEAKEVSKAKTVDASLVGADVGGKHEMEHQVSKEAENPEIMGEKVVNETKKIQLAAVEDPSDLPMNEQAFHCKDDVPTIDKSIEVDTLSKRKKKTTKQTGIEPTSFAQFFSRAIESSPRHSMDEPLEANDYASQTNNHMEVSISGGVNVSDHQNKHEVVAFAEPHVNAVDKEENTAREPKAKKSKKRVESHMSNGNLGSEKSRGGTAGPTQREETLLKNEKHVPQSKRKSSKVAENGAYSNSEFDFSEESLKPEDRALHACPKESSERLESRSRSGRARGITSENKRGKKEKNPNKGRDHVMGGKASFGVGEVVGRRSLLAIPGTIFKDNSSSESFEDETMTSDASTRTPSDSSSSASGYSQQAGRKRSGTGNNVNLSSGLEHILKSSKRYKKLAASQSQAEADSETQPVDFVPDSQAYLISH